MTEAVCAALQRAWYQGAWWLWLVAPLAWLYRLAIFLRRQFYTSGLLRQKHFSVPVVVIGNITVGGTGKTPVVIALVQALEERGIRAGVVARGYGGSATGMSPRVVTARSDAHEVGDEPVLIVQRTGCPCVVHADRARAVQALLAQFTVDLVISDDGLQHYAMGRDLEVVMYDTELGFGNGRCLPAGPLREPLSRLQQVDLVLSKGFDSRSADVLLTASRLVNLLTGASAMPADVARLGRVDAMAAIAHHAQFAQTLVSLGLPCDLHAFADHHRYSPADVSWWSERPVIMTEKDAVKLRALARDNVWYLPLDAVLPEVLVDQVVALVENRATSA